VQRFKPPLVVQGHPALLAGCSLHLIPGTKEIVMLAKQSVALIGRLLLMSLVCLSLAIALFLVLVGNLSYQLGLWLKKRVSPENSPHLLIQRERTKYSEDKPNPAPIPDPGEFPLELIVQPEILQFQPPHNLGRYLLPAARDPKPDDSAMTIRQLKNLARRNKIPNYGRMTKAQLIKTLFAT
jgi:hypothetical protein